MSIRLKSIDSDAFIATDVNGDTYDIFVTDGEMFALERDQQTYFCDGTDIHLAKDGQVFGVNATNEYIARNGKWVINEEER